ncbi:MAG: glycosyltransferase family 2 protein [Chitinophagaceae bacterium]|nr:glycosyltransferase family 2 protein [Oligoflexus sp.]
MTAAVLISLTIALLSFIGMARYHVLLALISRAARSLSLHEKPLRDHPRFTILVPAHNEELGIAATVGSIHALDYPRQAYRLIVIADNCTDQTAKAARACGAEVMERFDNAHRSKGYALEYALKKLQLETTPAPDAIVVIDADTRVDRKLLQAFGNRILEGQEWLQGYYSVSNPDDSWRTQLMTYAFALFNGVWLAGQDALGLGCSLRGNGMAFAWNALSRQPWRAYGLAEDLEFSWHLRVAGEKIHFVPEARVYGEIISGNEKASKAQRLRWEKGRAQLKAHFAPAVRQMPTSKFRRWLLLSDLKMLPLSRYFMATGVSWGASLGVVLLGFGRIDAAILGGILLGLNTFVFFTFAVYLSLPFRRLHLPWHYLKALTRVPFYVGWKFLLLLSRTPAQWVRTERIKKDTEV